MMKISYKDQNGKNVIADKLFGAAIAKTIANIPEGTPFTVTSTIGGKERTHHGKAHHKKATAVVATPVMSAQKKKSS
jgi:hypothetical protein